MNYHNILARIVVDCAFQIHYRLGPGLFESVYESLMVYELKKRKVLVEAQKGMPVCYDKLIFDEGFRADLVVDNTLIVELKSVEKTIPAHKKQLLTYLKISNFRLGLLINFGEPRIKDGITRLVNDL